MNKYLELINALKNQNGCDIIKNEQMKKHTSFQIGGPADIFIIIKTKDALKKVLSLTNKLNIQTFIIGKGSNLLVSDKGIRGVVIKLDGEFSYIKLLDGCTIECGAGVPLSQLCTFALKNSLSGLEFAWGIPGTAGGAAFMNAGAYDSEMKNVIMSCSHILKDGSEYGTFNKKQLDFSYRHSEYSKEAYVITSLTIKLNKGNHGLIKSKMDDFMVRRKSKQPLEYPSAGSVFKRPDGYFAGTLIENCDLKGSTENGAKISAKHAGFIVNIGGASCYDVLFLIELIKKTVKEKTNVNLECEIKILGEF